jgi:hypothetical protein
VSEPWSQATAQPMAMRADSIRDGPCRASGVARRRRSLHPFGAIGAMATASPVSLRIIRSLFAPRVEDPAAHPRSGADAIRDSTGEAGHAEPSRRNGAARCSGIDPGRIKAEDGVRSRCGDGKTRPCVACRHLPHLHHANQHARTMVERHATHVPGPHAPRCRAARNRAPRCARGARCTLHLDPARCTRGLTERRSCSRSVRSSSGTQVTHPTWAGDWPQRRGGCAKPNSRSRSPSRL